MTKQDTNADQPGEADALLKDITVLQRFLCVEDQPTSVNVIALFPQQDGRIVTRYAGQLFRRLAAEYLFVVGGTEGVDVDEARRSLCSQEIGEDRLIDPGTQMNTRRETEVCLRELRIRGVPFKGIAVVSAPHKALRYRTVVAQAAPGVPVFAAPPREGLMSFLPSCTDGRSLERRLVEMLAQEVQALQARFIRRDIQLPAACLEPVEGRGGGRRRLLDEVTEIADRYRSLVSHGDRRTLV